MIRCGCRLQRRSILTAATQGESEAFEGSDLTAFNIHALPRAISPIQILTDNEYPDCLEPHADDVHQHKPLPSILIGEHRKYQSSQQAYIGVVSI